MIFEWMSDPAAWVGLATLIVLEIVLGIDNLVFIAILAEKLPPEQRAKARIVGLVLALGMRLVLLASIAWVVTLTEPLFHILNHPFSGRDLICCSVVCSCSLKAPWNCMNEWKVTNFIKKIILFMLRSGWSLSRLLCLMLCSH